MVSDGVFCRILKREIIAGFNGFSEEVYNEAYPVEKHRFM
jgi:hypothetical protein